MNPVYGIVLLVIFVIFEGLVKYERRRKSRIEDAAAYTLTRDQYNALPQHLGYAVRMAVMRKQKKDHPEEAGPGFSLQLIAGKGIESAIFSIETPNSNGKYKVRVRAGEYVAERAG